MDDGMTPQHDPVQPAEHPAPATEAASATNARDTAGESYRRSDRAAQKRSRMVRLGVLVAGLVIITGIGVLHQKGGIAKPVGVDALCPFGGIETMWSLLTGAGLLQRIAVSSVILLGIVLVIALLFRRSFCGYICPLGALQELFGKIGGLIWKRNRPTVPAAIDRPARLLKYAILAFFTLWTWQAAQLVIRPYDPWVAWMHLTSAELFAEFGVGLAILGISLAGSIVYDRFFCKYLCPMGAFLGVLAPVSLYKVRRNADSCIDCAACDKACPVNVNVSTVETVTDRECINCNECVNACPVADTLDVADAPYAAGKRTSLRPQHVLGIVGGLIAVILVGSTVSGAFAWTMPSMAQAVQASGGTVNVEDIKGRMSFAEVAQATGIPAAEFEQQFGVAPADMTVPMKDLAPRYGFDVHTDVRDWVAQRLAASPPAQTAPAGGEGAGED